MGSVEAQLAEYRARKAKERTADQSSNTLSFANFSILRRNTKTSNSVGDKPQDQEVQQDEEENSNSVIGTASGDNKEARKEQHREYKPSRLVTFIAGNYYLSRIATFKYTSLILKVILWLVLWCLFIELEFGAVYFVISLLYVIYTSLGTGPRTGPSAYSVFNENFETLEGTFTAEEFDNQMRRGGGMM